MKSKKIYFGILIAFILISGCASQNLTSNIVSNPTNNENLRIAEIELPGLSCPGCALGAESAFKGMKGVVDAKVSYGIKKGTVIYDSTITTKEQLMQNALIQAYSGKILKDEQYNP